MEIGSWVRRQIGPGNRYPRWHYVESIIEGAAITKCGRRLEPTVPSDGELEVSVWRPDGRFCKKC